MKLLILIALLITTAATFAKTESKTSYIRPQVTIWPNGVDVRVWNSTDKDIRCSGTINVWTVNGRYKTHFYNATIYRGMTDYRRFTNFDNRDAYRSGSNFINCYAY
jgi:hypothetical protein